MPQNCKSLWHHRKSFGKFIANSFSIEISSPFLSKPSLLYHQTLSCPLQTLLSPLSLSHFHPQHCNAPMECHVSPVTNQATCECSQHCPALYKPVCGLDNRTYDSACHLALETCLRGNSQPRLGLLHQGVCGSNAISKSTNNKHQSLIVVNEEEHGDAINQLTSLQSNGNQQCAPNTCPNYG